MLIELSIVIMLLIVIILQNIAKLSYLRELVKLVNNLSRIEKDVGNYIHCDYEEVKDRVHNLHKIVLELKEDK